MGSGKEDLDGGKKSYSKIDLEDVDSYLPPAAALFLSKALSSRGWGQLREARGLDAGEVAAEWEDLPKAAGDYLRSLDSGLLKRGGADSRDESGPVPEDSPDGGSSLIQEESGEIEGEGVPFYY